MTAMTTSRLTFMGGTKVPSKAWGVYACACGWLGKKRNKDVRNGRTSSCGCFRKEATAARSKTHGHSIGRSQTSTLMIWNAMHARCSNPKNIRWDQYGGRGITVCSRWAKFENFLADMGERPAGKSIDRKNNDGNYSPDNCVWSDATDQVYNRSVTLRHEWKGRSWTTLELSKIANVPTKLIRSRLRQGWTVERAATTPRERE